jgi:hypothetical protein
MDLLFRKDVSACSVCRQAGGRQESEYFLTGQKIHKKSHRGFQGSPFAFRQNDDQIRNLLCNVSLDINHEMLGRIIGFL